MRGNQRKRDFVNITGKVLYCNGRYSHATSDLERGKRYTAVEPAVVALVVNDQYENRVMLVEEKKELGFFLTKNKIEKFMPNNK